MDAVAGAGAGAAAPVPTQARNPIRSISLVVPPGNLVAKAVKIFANKQNPDGTFEPSPFKSLFLSPWLYTAIFAVGFCITFGLTFFSSGVDLNTLDRYNLKVWWVGTLLSSVLFLLLFYLVFGSSRNFNKAMIFLLFSSLVIVQVSLLFSQINLKVK